MIEQISKRNGFESAIRNGQTIRFRKLCTFIINPTLKQMTRSCNGWYQCDHIICTFHLRFTEAIIVTLIAYIYLDNKCL